MICLSIVSRSLSEQSALLKSSDSRRVFSLVQDDTSSLLMIKDSESCYSKVTETTEQLDAMFDFDREVINSRVYQTAMRSHVRQLVAPEKGFENQVKDTRSMEYENVGNPEVSDAESMDDQTLAPFPRSIATYSGSISRSTVREYQIDDSISFTKEQQARMRRAKDVLLAEKAFASRLEKALLVLEEQRSKAQADVETWEWQSSVYEVEVKSLLLIERELRHILPMSRHIAELQGRILKFETRIAEAAKRVPQIAVTARTWREGAVVETESEPHISSTTSDD